MKPVLLLKHWNEPEIWIEFVEGKEISGLLREAIVTYDSFNTSIKNSSLHMKPLPQPQWPISVH